jgi:hypothetical protein
VKLTVLMPVIGGKSPANPFCALCTALCALILPPVAIFPLNSGSASTFSRINVFTAIKSEASCGRNPANSAAKPDTNGAAILVPDICW